MYPFKLGKRASVAEAQAASGFDFFQYKSFSAITHEAAKRLLDKDPEWNRWPRIPRVVKVEIQEWVNAELAKQSIPEIREDVLDWRMSKALPDAARANSNKKLSETDEGV